MTTVSFMTKEIYKETIQAEVGSLLFSDKYYNCMFHVDKKHLRKQFKEELKGKRLYAVAILTQDHPHFKNVQNKQVKYRVPVCADETTDGAYQRGMFWFTDHPVGDAILVYSTIKAKK